MFPYFSTSMEVHLANNSALYKVPVTRVEITPKNPTAKDPRFKPGHLFLQFLYPLGQGKLLFLRQQEFALEVYDRAVTSSSIVDVLESLGHIEGGLDRVQASKRFGNNHLVTLHEHSGVGPPLGTKLFRQTALTLI